jgi:hypothetical protein
MMTGQSFQDMALRVALDREIARTSDGYDKRAREYASRLTGTRLDKTQVRGLEVLACTTDKVSDITDWLKLRVGRDSNRDRWAKDGVGRDLLSALEGLRNDAQKIVAALSKTYSLDADQERQVHLRLCREFLKHLAAHFEYLKAEQKR